MRIDRFNARIHKTDSCWLWTGAINHRGYGRYGKELAHRVSVRLSGVSIPKGKVVDHLCRVRNCVNPAHLRVVTVEENIFADKSESIPALNKLKTNCINGHPYVDGNIYFVGTRKHRVCRECRLAAANARHRRRRNA